MLLRTYVPMPVLEGMRNIPFDSGVARSATVDDIELRREDIIMGVTVVSASVTVMPSFGAIPQYTKTITASFSADGVITANGSELGDDGRPMGIAACRFDFTIAELTATVPRAFLMTVTDSLGRDTPYAQGFLVPTAAETPETPVDHVVISPTELLVKVGSIVQMAATAYDASGVVLPGRVVTYSSSDEGIATVDAIGLVTTAGEGEVVVTAASGGKQARAKVVAIPDVLLLATFTDADATDVDDWACDTGQLAEVLVGAAAIESNQCRLSGADALLRFDAIRADAQGELELSGSEGGQYLAFRIVDDLNFLMIGMHPDVDAILISSCVAGTMTPGAGSVDLGTRVGRVGVICDGDQLQMLWNGSTDGLAGPYTLATHQTATGWGARGDGALVDSLTVQALP